MSGFYVNTSRFVLNWTGFVLNKTWLALNMTSFVINMTGFVINLTQFFLYTRNSQSCFKAIQLTSPHQTSIKVINVTKVLQRPSICLTNIKMSHQNVSKNVSSKCLIKMSYLKYFLKIVSSKCFIKTSHQNVSSKCLIKMSHQHV